MKRGIALLLLSLVLFCGCGQTYEQEAAALTGSFTREPMLITAAAPTITPARHTATPVSTEKTVSLPTHTPVLGTEEMSFPTSTPSQSLLLTPSPTPKAASASALCELVTALQGTVYAPGGDSPDTGFDTAGFVYYCLNEIGLNTPRRTVRGYAEHEEWDKVTYLSSAKAGDLLFFVTGEENEIDCVCIYLGNGKMSYPSTSRGAVITVSSTTEYWKNHFRLGRRVF